MKDFSNKYILVFSVIMVVVVAVLLSLVATLLKPAQDKNYEIEKKRSMLESIGVFSDSEEAERLYDDYISSGYVVNVNGVIIDDVVAFDVDVNAEQKKELKDQYLPFFPAVTADGVNVLIVPVYGAGLWGPIWGYIALKDDFNTIFGVTFDHEGETPGLGAEINTTAFETGFIGKKIFDEDKFVSIGVRKVSQKKDPDHDVDAISGGTLTSRSLEKMLLDCLGKYEKFFNENRKN